MKDKLKVLIVDDHKLILDSLYLLFSMIEKIGEVYKHSDSRKVMDFLRENEIDVLVTDFKMPYLDGLQLIHMVKNEFPKINILVLSVNERSSDIRSAYHAGALGFILKKASRSELEDAVLTVAKGDKYFGQNAMSAMLLEDNIEENEIGVENKISLLTKREVEIVKLLYQELSSSEIAALLFISTGTVETHRHNILRKLGVKSTIGVVKFGIMTGIV